MAILTRREFVKTVAGSAALLALAEMGFAADAPPPNVVFILADDLGYADLGCYGAREIRTPNVDRMAAKGVRFECAYSASPVCTPSRVALMTGRHPVRVGLDRILGTKASAGLPESEVTLAQILKQAGYATACVGKWHLGHEPKFLPTRRGFDRYFGLPYSNDMKPLYLLRGEQNIEEPADLSTLTKRYTDEALAFIRENKGRPFFLYLAHTFPHIPLAASPAFRGKSKAGLYGDAVEELDWSTGEVLRELKRLGLEGSTLVVFTSDNGPWLVKGKDAGSAGPLRGGKATAFEGGIRVPCLATWPGKIRPGGVVKDPIVLTDWFTTILTTAGAAPPKDRVIDGQDIGGLLLGTGKRADSPFIFSMSGEIQAIRSGPWKLMPPYKGAGAWTGKDGETPHGLLLFNIERDGGETTDVAPANPDVVARLQAQLAAFRAGLKS